MIKINIYYDETKIINDFMIAFYAQGKRARIQENQLVIDEIVLDMNELVSEQMCGPSYKRHPIMWNLYQRHYKHVLGNWVYRTEGIKSAISSLCENISDTMADNSGVYLKLAELTMKLQSLGNMPVNHNKLPKGIITFLHIDQYVDDPNCTAIDFRSKP
jgi:hypothetical protein